MVQPPQFAGAEGRTELFGGSAGMYPSAKPISSVFQIRSFVCLSHDGRTSMINRFGETGLSGFAVPIQVYSLIGSYVMATAEHRERAPPKRRYQQECIFGERSEGPQMRPSLLERARICWKPLLFISYSNDMGIPSPRTSLRY
jgi:hypothetical protein